MSLQSMVDIVMRNMAHPDGIPGALRDDEAARGYKVVKPGEVDWLGADDWSPNTVVSLNGRRARLILMEAKNPGRGALTRLIMRIRSSGLKPVIIAPTAELQATLKRWRWSMQIVGSSFEDREDQWSAKS